MYNLWLIFSIATIAGMGIYVGWHFAKAIASGLSAGIDWLAVKIMAARDRARERMDEDAAPEEAGDMPEETVAADRRS
jgi:hypothetical protein